MLQKLWVVLTRIEVGMAALIVLAIVSVWGGFQQAVFYSRGMAVLLAFLAFSLTAFSIERVRQLMTQELTFKKFGSIFAHMSVVVLLAAGLYGKLGGYVLQVPLPEGEVFHESRSHFNIGLTKFYADIDNLHRPLQFRSDITLWDEGKEKEKINATTAMNSPYVFKGVKIYQAAYGLSSLVLSVNGSGIKKDVQIQLALDGSVLRGDMIIPLARAGEVLILDKVSPDIGYGPRNNPIQLSTLPKNPGLLIFYNPHFTKDPLNASPVGWASKDREVSVAGYHLKLRDFKVFSGLQLRKDPGLPLALTGFIFLIVGLIFMFYIPERKKGTS